MTLAQIKKQEKKVDQLTRDARRALLEFQVLVSKWEIENGKYKVYSSAKALMRDIKKRAA